MLTVLRQGIDHKALYDTFSMFGNILSCKVAMSPNGESLGYGFVHYENEESALKAIAKVDGMVISGSNVQVARWKPRSERSGDANKFTNIYVKGLPDSVDSEGLRAMFERYGPVTSFLLATDADGKSRGFGFVNFERVRPVSAFARCWHDELFHISAISDSFLMSFLSPEPLIAIAFPFAGRERVG